MLAAIKSAAVLGVESYDVTVEVDVAQGLPMWTLVGMPSGAVKESRERVSAALVNSGFIIPPRRITINLSPEIVTSGKRRDETPTLELAASQALRLSSACRTSPTESTAE